MLSGPKKRAEMPRAGQRGHWEAGGSGEGESLTAGLRIPALSGGSGGGAAEKQHSRAGSEGNSGGAGTKPQPFLEMMTSKVSKQV